MRVLVWVLVWTVLLGAAAAFLWARLRRLWRQGTALGAEVAEAEARLSSIEATLVPAEPRLTSPADLAVFGSPGVLRAEWATQRAVARQARAERRAAALPLWARPRRRHTQDSHVDSDTRPPKEALL